MHNFLKIMDILVFVLKGKKHIKEKQLMVLLDVEIPVLQCHLWSLNIFLLVMKFVYY